MSDIRPATPDDSEELARLQAEYHAERYGPSNLGQFREDFARFAHDSLTAGWTAWVSETAEGLEGAVWCHHDLDRPTHERDWVAVTRLKVDPLADESAVAARLVDHVLAWARDAGFRSVVAWPSPEQHPIFVDRGFHPEAGGALVAPLGEHAEVSRSEAGGALAADEDHLLAASVADEAGRLLVSLRAEMGFAVPDRLKREGDRRSHDLIVALLVDARPRDRIVSEEETEEERKDAGAPDRSDSPRVWIVDPLDGTREFAEEGRADWAVHVALCVDGQPMAGAVALPARGLTFSTADPPSVPPALAGSPRLLVSRTRRPAPLLELADRLDAELIEMGSAGAKAMAVVAGDADVYAHVGGQYEWDSAAPVAVAQAAGLHTSRLDGSPLVYDRADPWLPDLLICRPELAHRVLETYRSTKV